MDRRHFLAGTTGAIGATLISARALGGSFSERIVPEKAEEKPGKWPDFEARAREILGERVLPNVVLEDRGRY